MHDQHSLAAFRLHRRHFLAGAAALVGCVALRHVRAAEPRPLSYADMHSHLGILRGPADVRRAMSGNGMLVIARNIVADGPVIRDTGRGIFQMRQASPGELPVRFDAALERVRAEHKAEALVEIDSLGALDRVEHEHAPGVVIASEGADFLEGDITRLARYRALGLVHLQLVHYRQNEIGDISTARPQYEGLSAAGKSLVRECNRLGILVDVAHATSNGIAQALEISTKPMVYSHGHVTFGPEWTQGQIRARAVHRPLAQKIAEKGGVIGLWPLGSQFRSLDAYASELIELTQLLGLDHVGVGTDMSGLPSSVMTSYSAFPALAEVLAKRGMKAADVAKVLGGNYVRVLRAAM